MPRSSRNLVSNLVRNAIVHNVPADGRVWIAADREQGRPRLRIENSGTHFAAGEVAALTEPFRRGTARARTAHEHHVGAGLGLAIVASIANAHGAELTIDPRPQGDLKITVTFPSPESQPAHKPGPCTALTRERRELRE